MENEVKLFLPINLYDDILRVTKSDIDFSKFNNKTVLITSAGEMLGFYLVCAFLTGNDINNTNTRVIAVDNDDSLFKQYGKLTYRNDIEFIVSKDYSNLTEKADYVIHTKKPESEIEILNILEYIKSNKCASVINFDADIYGDVFNGKDSICENEAGYCDCFNTEDYSIQLERLFESAAKVAAKEYNLDIKFTRLSQLFGYRKYGNHSGYFKIFNNVADKQNIEIQKSDGKLRGYVYVTDAASAVIKVLTDGKTCAAYNVSSDYVASNHIIAKYCVKLFENLDIKVVYKEKRASLSPMEPTIYNLDNSKLKALGFTPEVELQDGIVRALKIIYEEKN